MQADFSVEFTSKTTASFGVLGPAVGAWIAISVITRVLAKDASLGIALLGGVMVVGCLLYVARERSQLVEVRVQAPRLHLICDGQTRSCLLRGATVVHEGDVVFVEPPASAGLRIPVAGVHPQVVRNLVRSLDRFVGGDAGTSREIPEALQGLRD